MRSFRLLSLVVALALPLAAAAQQITVSAAASLTDAFKEIGPKFEAAKSGATVRFNFAASACCCSRSARARRWTCSPAPTRTP